MSKSTRNSQDLSYLEVFGRPALLAGESPALYQQLWDLVVADLEPKTLPEWLLVKDIVDAQWEVIRLKAMKVRIVNAQVRRTIDQAVTPSRQLSVRKKSPPALSHVVRRFTEGEAGARAELEEFLRKHKIQIDLDDVTAAAFVGNISSLQHADQMIDAALRRLERAYGQSERLRLVRRGHFVADAPSLRTEAQPVIDAVAERVPGPNRIAGLEDFRPQAAVDDV